MVVPVTLIVTGNNVENIHKPLDRDCGYSGTLIRAYNKEQLDDGLRDVEGVKYIVVDLRTYEWEPNELTRLGADIEQGRFRSVYNLPVVIISALQTIKTMPSGLRCNIDGGVYLMIEAMSIVVGNNAGETNRREDIKYLTRIMGLSPTPDEVSPELPTRTAAIYWPPSSDDNVLHVVLIDGTRLEGLDTHRLI
jgi:hypothetical protein